MSNQQEETYNLIKEFKLFNKDQNNRHIEEPVISFFKKIPSDKAKKLIKEIRIMAVGSNPITIINLQSSIKEKKGLIILGNLNDLNDRAIIGLIAHLFALIDIDYDKQSPLKGKKWLEKDLYSDKIARGWGFKDEVDELRKIRPQKIPISIDYGQIILPFSVPDASFKKFMTEKLGRKISSTILSDIRIFYIGRFSAVCNIEILRKSLIKKLIVITDSYEEIADPLEIVSNGA